MKYTANIEHASLPKDGESVSGDTIVIQKSPERLLLLLSDGLGSGIAASVSSILTTEILVHLLENRIPLEETLRLLARTLPVHPTVQQAYATMTVIDIDRISHSAVISTIGNPPVFFFRHSVVSSLPTEVHLYDGKQCIQQKISLQPHDVLIAMTDGFPGSSSDSSLDNGVTITSLSRTISQFLLTHITDAHLLKEELLRLVHQSFGEKLSDDASFVIVQSVPSAEATILIGPPSSKKLDDFVVQRFLSSDGEKIICGGTTSEIVSTITGIPIRILPHSACDGVPPYATMETIDLVTEGILTVTKAIQYLSAKEFPHISFNSDSPNGAWLLAQKLLNANVITFMVGDSDNSYYRTNRGLSSGTLRKSLVRQCVSLLESYGKEVYVELY